MNKIEYLETMRNKLNNYFEIEEQAEVLNNIVDLYAKCQLTLGRTLFTKKDIVDKFETNEHILFKYYESFTENNLMDFLEYSKALPEGLVKPHSYHKSTYINAIIVCDDKIKESFIKKINKFKCEKIYHFYLKGYCEVRLLVISLQDNCVITNKAGKSIKKMYLNT